MLLPNLMADLDSNAETRTGTISVFDGPPPAVQTFPSEDAEAGADAAWIRARLAEGYLPDEIGVFVLSEAQLHRARTAITQAGQERVDLSDEIEAAAGRVAVSTMHLAKGLEFRAVVVMACDEDVLPLPDRIETVTDDADLEEVYNTGRHLLYVACTRARDYLLITGVAPASEFLRDFQLAKGRARA
jgi:superfamily I DNA/RNA helicase